MMKSFMRGFTLIELLLVLAIIGATLGLLLPAVSCVYDRALATSCRSNMRQIGLAFNFYSLEHWGRLPHSDRDSDTGPDHCWFEKLDPYLRTSNLHTVKQCPGWSGYNRQGETLDQHSLKMNAGLCNKERLPETSEDREADKWYWPRTWRIKNHSRTVLLLDGRMDTPFNTHTDTRCQAPFLDIANRHAGGANILFLDGSCCHKNADGEGIAIGEIGWLHEGGYIWEPYH